MRVVVTGIGGLIGSRLAAWLLREQAGVVVLGIDDFSTGTRRNVPPGVTLIEATLGKNQVRDVLAGADIVYHCAAYAAECLSPFVRCHTLASNVVGTAEVISACIEHEVPRLVFCSSVAVYGRQSPPFHEDAPCRPVDTYGVSKLASELDLQVAGEQHELSWAVARLHNVYGPGQSLWQVYRNVFGLWMARHREGQPIQLYGDGSQRRAFTYVEDVLPALWAMGARTVAHQVAINVGSDEPLSLSHAAQVFDDVVGGCQIEHTPPRHEVAEAFCTHQRCRDWLGVECTTPLSSGLAAMWRWAADQPPHVIRHPPLEVTRGLPACWQPAHSYDCLP